MCVVGRKVLIHGEARKNKSHRKKYFVLNCCASYTRPRLDYFSGADKWIQHRNDIYTDLPDPSSTYKSIDLSNLFFVDDIHRCKPKCGGLDLYMEDKHVTLTFPSDEVKNQWKEIFDNVVYKNGKIKSYPKIEHVLQVGLRFKSKGTLDKAPLLQLKGEFRACFMKMSLIFVNKSLSNPNFVMEYQFIRQLESRSDGTFRLEIGRAASIGECNLVMQLADNSEANAAHKMLVNCSKSFKVPLPEPVRMRNSCYKLSDRTNSVSSTRQMSLISSAFGPTRSESCMDYSGADAFSILGSRANTTIASLPQQEPEHYMVMNTPTDNNINTDDNSPNVTDGQNYFEHISRIYKCLFCGCLTRVVRFCSRCTTTTTSDPSLRQLFKSDSLVGALATKLLPSIRGKAQSLTERPHLHSQATHGIRAKQCVAEQPPLATISQTSQSSSKTSTNDMSSSSKLESQNSLSISSNRHDDEIFAEMHFDNLDHPPSSTSNRSAVNAQTQLKCHHCHNSLGHHLTSAHDLISESDQQCSKCSADMLFVTMAIDESDTGDYTDWIPRTTSLNGTQYSRHSTAGSHNCNSEYVDSNHKDIINRDPNYIHYFCS